MMRPRTFAAIRRCWCRWRNWRPTDVPRRRADGGGEVAANGRRSWVCTRRACPNIIVRSTTQFDIVDVARKVVGVGSVGLQAWVILMWGKGENDPPR